jgi:hypothetical protein
MPAFKNLLERFWVAELNKMVFLARNLKNGEKKILILFNSVSIL